MSVIPKTNTFEVGTNALKYLFQSKLEWIADVSAKKNIKFASRDYLMCYGWVFVFVACLWSPISYQPEAAICQTKQNPFPPFFGVFLFFLPSPALLRFRA